MDWPFKGRGATCARGWASRRDVTADPDDTLKHKPPGPQTIVKIVSNACPRAIALGTPTMSSKTPEIITTWTTLEKLLLAQAVYKCGDGQWPAVSRTLRMHAAINRPADFLSHKNCASQYNLLVEQMEIEKKHSKVTPTAASQDMPAVVKLAKQLYLERISELKQAIKHDEDKFRALVTEIDEIRSGKWDAKLNEILRQREQARQAEAATVSGVADSLSKTPNGTHDTNGYASAPSEQLPDPEADVAAAAATATAAATTAITVAAMVTVAAAAAAAGADGAKTQGMDVMMEEAAEDAGEDTVEDAAEAAAEAAAEEAGREQEGEASEVSVVQINEEDINTGNGSRGNMDTSVSDRPEQQADEVLNAGDKDVVAQSIEPVLEESEEEAEDVEMLEQGDENAEGAVQPAAELTDSVQHTTTAEHEEDTFFRDGSREAAVDGHAQKSVEGDASGEWEDGSTQADEGKETSAEPSENEDLTPRSSPVIAEERGMNVGGRADSIAPKIVAGEDSVGETIAGVVSGLIKSPVGVTLGHAERAVLEAEDASEEEVGEASQDTNGIQDSSMKGVGEDAIIPSDSTDNDKVDQMSTVVMMDTDGLVGAAVAASEALFLANEKVREGSDMDMMDIVSSEKVESAEKSEEMVQGDMDGDGRASKRHRRDDGIRSGEETESDAEDAMLAGANKDSRSHGELVEEGSAKAIPLPVSAPLTPVEPFQPLSEPSSTYSTPTMEIKKRGPGRPPKHTKTPSLSLTILTKRDKSRDGPGSEDEGPESMTPGAEEASDVGRKKDEHRQKSWQKNINLLWREISNHKNGAMFMNPIKEQSAPNYFEIVRRPMDLKQIKQRIRDGQTRNTVEFERDILLMLVNALMYNKEDTEIHQMALEMLEDVGEQIRVFKTADAFSTAAAAAAAGFTVTTPRLPKESPIVTSLRRKSVASDEAASNQGDLPDTSLMQEDGQAGLEGDFRTKRKRSEK